MRERIIDKLRRAAAESDVEARALAALRDRVGDIAISTIDAFCYALLREFPLEAGLAPGFTVADETESARLAEDASIGRWRGLPGIAASDAAWRSCSRGSRRRGCARALAHLVDRRLVAGRRCDRYIGREPASHAGGADGAGGGTLSRRAAARCPVGCRRSSPKARSAHPRFALIAADLRAISRGDIDDPATLAAVVETLRFYFTTQDGSRARASAQRLQEGATSVAERGKRHAQALKHGAPAVFAARQGYAATSTCCSSRGVRRIFAVTATSTGARSPSTTSSTSPSCSSAPSSCCGRWTSSRRAATASSRAITTCSSTSSRTPAGAVAAGVAARPVAGARASAWCTSAGAAVAVHRRRSQAVDLPLPRRRRDAARRGGRRSAACARTAARGGRSRAASAPVPALLAFVNDVCAEIRRRRGDAARRLPLRGRRIASRSTPSRPPRRASRMTTSRRSASSWPRTARRPRRRRRRRDCAAAGVGHGARSRDRRAAAGARPATSPSCSARATRTASSSARSRRAASRPTSTRGSASSTPTRSRTSSPWSASWPIRRPTCAPPPLPARGWSRSPTARWPGSRRTSRPPSPRRTSPMPRRRSTPADAVRLAQVRDALPGWLAMVDRFPPADVLDHVLAVSAYADVLRRPRAWSRRARTSRSCAAWPAGSEPRLRDDGAPRRSHRSAGGRRRVERRARGRARGQPDDRARVEGPRVPDRLRREHRPRGEPAALAASASTCPATTTTRGSASVSIENFLSEDDTLEPRARARGDQAPALRRADAGARSTVPVGGGQGRHREDGTAEPRPIAAAIAAAADPGRAGTRRRRTPGLVRPVGTHVIRVASVAGESPVGRSIPADVAVGPAAVGRADDRPPRLEPRSHAPPSPTWPRPTA